MAGKRKSVGGTAAELKRRLAVLDNERRAVEAQIKMAEGQAVDRLLEDLRPVVADFLGRHLKSGADTDLQFNGKVKEAVKSALLTVMPPMSSGAAPASAKTPPASPVADGAGALAGAGRTGAPEAHQSGQSLESGFVREVEKRSDVVNQ